MPTKLWRDWLIGWQSCGWGWTSATEERRSQVGREDCMEPPPQVTYLRSQIADHRSQMTHLEVLHAQQVEYHRVGQAELGLQGHALA